MEYLPGGDLGALLEHVGYLDEQYTRFYVAQIVLALEHLHRYPSLTSMVKSRQWSLIYLPMLL